MADQFDVAIIGAGPAGLSAAILLGRCRRSVVVIDSGKPRNHAAKSVNGYLGFDAPSPADFRKSGRQQAVRSGVQFIDAELETARCTSEPTGRFELTLPGRPTIVVRKLLLATGVRDVLPDIENIEEYYGKSVHHCPYCDGWEHRDERLVAIGEGDALVSLALLLRTWSGWVAACSTGKSLNSKNLARLQEANVAFRAGRPVRFDGVGGVLRGIGLLDAPLLPCDAVFFSSGQAQRSHLPELLGCECDSEGLLCTGKKQTSGVKGLYLAGDADGDVQFAIVAAAEGAVAATAINQAFQDETSVESESITPTSAQS